MVNALPVDVSASVDGAALAGAPAGDSEAFRRLTDTFRREHHARGASG